jgi:hypothetical protein
MFTNKKISPRSSQDLQEIENAEPTVQNWLAVWASLIFIIAAFGWLLSITANLE